MFYNLVHSCTHLRENLQKSKLDREFKNELSYGQNDNSTKDINTASNKVIEKNNSSNKYGVSSYSIKNQKMNYECGEGESL